mmetsp:Transcript_7625/g.25094  ORF Transcript_7625/g.25094 Transcript_7625/m.25094 type:complete len:223 (-) Transcript_7625:188-856(-)
MRKRLLLLRHGQALHNPRAEARRAAGCSFDEFLHTMKEDALDADLTPLGRQQAAAACNSVDGGAASLGIELIVASSLSRAIETAALAFPEAAAAGRDRFISLDCLCERSGWLLSAVGFDLLTETDECWTEELEEEAACAQRGYEALLWVARRPESTIAVVAHGGIFHYLLSQHSKVSADAPTAARFGNAELRACTLCWKDEAAGTLRLEADESVQPSAMSGV